MKKLLAFVLLAAYAFSGIPAGTVWEVRPTNGNDNNGGGFVTGSSGTDFSQQNAAQYTFTNLASTSGTTNPCVVTSASHNFVATDVGNIMQITAGTNWTTGFYEIVSVATNAATLDRACASAASVTNGTFAVGGALKTLTQMNTAMQQGNQSWVKAESTITSGAAVQINFTGGGNGQLPAINGYTTTRGDNGQVTLQASGSTGGQPLMNVTSPGVTIANFVIDCNAQTNTQGLALSSTGIRGWNILAKGCTASFGIHLNGNGANCGLCTVTTMTAGGTNGGFLSDGGNMNICFFCVSYLNTGSGFVAGAQNQFICINCIAASNSGVLADGFAFTANQGSSALINCVSFGNGRDGVRFNTQQQGLYTIINTISFNNTGVGFNNTTSAQPAGTVWFDYNAVGSNTGGNRTNVTAGAHDVTLSADPFVASGSQNFALNSTAGGGTALKGVGFPGALAVGGTGSADIGALQHAPSGGAASQNGYITN